MEPLFALQALGEFGSAMSKSSIDEDRQVLHIGSKSYPLDDPTPARRTAGARKGDPYTLRDIYVALLHMDASLREYVAYCQTHGVSRLMEAERKELVKFMLGELSFEESSLFDTSAVASADQTLRAASTIETTQTTAQTKADLQAEKESLDERFSVKEVVASSSVKIERDEHDVSASNQDTRHGTFDESAYVARCIAMERVQRSCDGFFELDKRKGIDFTTFPVIEALRKSVIAGPPEDVPAVENAAVSGRASVDGQPTLVTAKASDLDIARGDRYRTDPLRAYREAGLADLERLEIDPAAGFASVAASLLEPGSNALSGRDSMETTLGESTAASTGRSERTRTPTAAGHGRDNGPAGVVVTKKHASADGTQAQTGNDHDTLYPIIILPSGQQPLITMLNVKPFVESGTFVPQEELRKQGVVRKPAPRIQISHRGQTYVFTDQPNQLMPAEWERVAVVVCQGASWQFKGWPFPNGPAQLFAAVKGVYFYYEDEQIPLAVRQWAVKCIPIHRHRRYTDEGAAREFWSIVNQACRRARPV